MDNRLSESCPPSLFSRHSGQECGYLNVKKLQLGPERKNKDRNWYCYWTQISSENLIMYKVDSQPYHATVPSTDKTPPPKQLMEEAERIFLSKAIVQLEYTYKVDAKNRRKNLFRITLESGADYMLQAPSEGAATFWVRTLQEKAGRYAHNSAVDNDFMIEVVVKRMREKAKKSVAPIHTPILLKNTAPVLDPDLLNVKNRLQRKIDLLYHLRQMENSFSRQYELARSPSPDIHPAPLDEECLSISSGGSSSTGRSSRVFEKKETKILEDYYLISGAKWSLLHKGEDVIVQRELANGYYMVKAIRYVLVDIFSMGNLSMKKNVSDSAVCISSKNLVPTGSDALTDTSADNQSPAVSIVVEHGLAPSDSILSDLSTDSGIVESKRVSNVSIKSEDDERSDRMRLEDGDGGYVTMLKPPPNLCASSLPLPQDSPDRRTFARELRGSCSTSNVTERTARSQVLIPLVGCVPPSVLECFIDQPFQPVVVRTPQSSSLVLQTPTKQPLSAKKRKSFAKTNRFSLQVESFDEGSDKRKSNTLPQGFGGKKKSFKPKMGGLFKKRASHYADRKIISTNEKGFTLAPMDNSAGIERVNSPVSDYTPVTDSGQQFRRRGKSFVYTAGDSSSESEDETSPSSSEKSSQEQSEPARHRTPSTEDINSASSSTTVASKEEIVVEEELFSLSQSPTVVCKVPYSGIAKQGSLQEERKRTKSSDSPTFERTRPPLSKAYSLPINAGSFDNESLVERKRLSHRLSSGDGPAVEISMRAPPLNKKRYVYLNTAVQKFGFRLETFGHRLSSSNCVAETIVYTVTQGTTAFLAGLYPGDVILEVEGTNVSNKNCNEIGSIIAGLKSSLEEICLTVKYIDGVNRIALLKKMEEQKHQNERLSLVSSEGDASGNEDDSKSSSVPPSPDPISLGRISETVEEAQPEDENYVPQTISPSQA